MSKNNAKKHKKRNFTPLAAVKVLMLLSSLYFSGAMTALSGAGLVYNRESYGGELEKTGIFLIISAALMILGAFLCLFVKKLADILAIVFSMSGLALCMAMLKKLTDHADKSGWTDKYTLLPISDMYSRRILPCIVPVVLAVLIAAIQLRSHRKD